MNTVNLVLIFLLELFDMIPVDDQVEKIRKWSKSSFESWKIDQGEKYEEKISNLRWNVDFKKNQKKNLQSIDTWLEN